MLDLCYHHPCADCTKDENNIRRRQPNIDCSIFYTWRNLPDLDQYSRCWYATL